MVKKKFLALFLVLALALTACNGIPGLNSGGIDDDAPVQERTVETETKTTTKPSGTTVKEKVETETKTDALPAKPVAAVAPEVTTNTPQKVEVVVKQEPVAPIKVEIDVKGLPSAGGPAVAPQVKPDNNPAPPKPQPSPAAAPGNTDSAAALLPSDKAVAGCDADKVATFPENDANVRHRKEVNGGGYTHHEHYANRGIQTVSFIFGPMPRAQAPSILWGYGSQWEWAKKCSAVEYIADVTEYAQVRGFEKNVGHSGVVLDFRTTPARMVANLAKLSTAQVNQLFVQNGLPFRVDDNGILSNADLGSGFNATTNTGNGAQAGGATPNNRLPTGNEPPVQQTQTGSAQPAANANVGQPQKREPKVGQYWDIPDNGTWRVVTLWTNQPGKDQTERKTLLAPTDSLSVLAGGTYYPFGGDEAGARAKFDSINFNPVTIGTLKTEGLAR